MAPSEVGFAEAVCDFSRWGEKKHYYITFNAKEQGRQRYKMPRRCKEIEQFCFRGKKSQRTWSRAAGVGS